MKKFVELCKKPLLIVAAVLFVAFTALLVVSLTTPVGKTYKVSQDKTMGEIKVKVTSKITFTSDTELELVDTYELDSKTVDALKELAKKEMGSEYTDEAFNTQIEELKKATPEKYAYKIVDGKLLLSEKIDDLKEVTDQMKEGAPVVKGYKIIVDEGTSNEVAYVCAANTALEIASAVLMAVSGVALLGCVVVLVLSNKGIIKTEKATETTETAAE